MVFHSLHRPLECGQSSVRPCCKAARARTRKGWGFLRVEPRRAPRPSPRKALATVMLCLSPIQMVSGDTFGFP